jgi:hypothetical protein
MGCTLLTGACGVCAVSCLCVCSVRVCVCACALRVRVCGTGGVEPTRVQPFHGGEGEGGEGEGAVAVTSLDHD